MQDEQHKAFDISMALGQVSLTILSSLVLCQRGSHRAQDKNGQMCHQLQVPWANETLGNINLVRYMASTLDCDLASG